MSEHKHVSDGLVQVLSRSFARFACPGKIDGAPVNGVIVEWNNKIVGMVRFVFVTRDDLHVSREIYLPEFALHNGRGAIEELLNSTRGAIAQARAERNQQNSSLIGINQPALKPIARAINRALN